jgi:hydrogenase maturation factor
VPEISRRVCAAFGLNPLATIASGALLMAAAAEDSLAIRAALAADGILCAEIGRVEEGPAGLYASGGAPLPRPPRDEIASVFEQGGA